MICVLSLDTGLAPVRADFLSDCLKGSTNARIGGCSRIIESKRLFGEPISIKKLAMAHNNRGGAYSADRQFDKALADFQQAIHLNPGYALAWFNRGAVHAKQGKIDSAITDYSTAIKLDSKMVFAYHNRGNAYRAKGAYDKAVADYREALRLSPKMVFTYVARASAYEKSGQREKAIADYSKANELLPGGKLGSAGLKRLGAGE